MEDLEAEGVIRQVLHLDVFMLVVVINIIGITTQNQHINVVIILNVYAKTQKYVPNAQSIHIVKVVPIQHVHHVHQIDQPNFKTGQTSNDSCTIKM